MQLTLLPSAMPVGRAASNRAKNTIPYIGHFPGAASDVIDHDANENEAIAALFHDCPEDQGLTKES